MNGGIDVGHKKVQYCKETKSDWVAHTVNLAEPFSSSSSAPNPQVD